MKIQKLGSCLKLPSSIRALAVVALATALPFGGHAAEAGSQHPDVVAFGHLHFSDQPTDHDIFLARVFDEPLVPSSDEPLPGENQALSRALLAYADRPSPDDFSALTDFLGAHRDSRWNASLLLHLGVEYYRSGYYSRALNAFELSWADFQKASNPKAKAQADRTAGELSQMYARLGRLPSLAKLLDFLKDRDLQGPAVSLLNASKDARWMMLNKPGVCFRCGPLALERIRTYKHPEKAWNPLILDARSTTNGFSLDQVADLSVKLGMNYQMAFRSGESDIVVPSVVHWKSEHYAAIVDHDGDRYLIQDSTFPSGLWMTKAALEEEASGYFLIPPHRLPIGWRQVDESEAKTVWGRGITSQKDPNRTTCKDTQSGGDSCNDGKCVSWVGGGNGPGSPGGTGGPGGNSYIGGPGVGSAAGMPTYTMHTLLVSLALHDIPLGYNPPVGPSILFSINYHQLEANQPATFYYSNLGPLWTCNCIAYITDNPSSPNADVGYYVDGGGTVNFTGFNPSTSAYANDMFYNAQLTKLSSSSYVMTFQDGSKKFFEQSDGSVGTSRRIFLTRVMDPAGNYVQLTYDILLRVRTMVDAIGQITTFQYTNIASPYLITGVHDPFGRTAHFQYNGNGFLSQVTDVINLSSSFQYGANDFISSMTTPYGTTTFTTGGYWLQALDPLGGKERLEFNQFDVEANPPVPLSDPPGAVPHGMQTWNDYLTDRDSFYWDKKACAEAYGNYSMAHIYHFCHDINGSSASGVLESEKNALENRVWYNHQGQGFSGSVNEGMMSQPSMIGRVLDDGTSQLYAYAYNSLGNITTSIDPVGRTFSYIYDTNGFDLLETRMTRNGENELLRKTVYNSQHLPLLITDASGQTWTNTYNSQGQLLTSTDPLGEMTTYSYGTNGYLLSITGPLQTTNDITRLTYDTFGRVKTIADIEGYTLTYDYDALNRKTRTTYPDGTYEQYVYTFLDLTATRDRLGRWSTNTFNAIRQLTSTQDPLGRLTQYGWCHCGALTSLTDPMGRQTTWDYDIQGRKIAKQYVDGSTVQYTYENTTSRLKSRVDEKGQFTIYEYYSDNALKRLSYPNALVATPTVTFTYDPDYNRLLTMHDGIGQTVYSYNAITSPPSLGAGRLASVSGPVPNSLVTYQYDQLERAINRTINGVAQTIAFDALRRVSIVTNALGTFQYSYVDATSRPLSESYPNGQTNLYAYYDNLGDQRLQQILHLKPNGSLLSSFGYTYNSSGAITCWTNQTDTTPTRYWALSYDAGDQLTNAVLSDDISTLDSHVYAYDPAGNRLSEITLTATNKFSYNALNQLVAGPPLSTNTTYQWNAENRLTAITAGSRTSAFTYDGHGRCAGIVETQNGLLASGMLLLWCGTDICEVRDTNGTTVVRRLFEQGESDSQGTGINYFYTRDHLRSVREVYKSPGDSYTRIVYDPYGQETVPVVGFLPTFRFGSYFLHSPSGLYLTLNRPYQAAIGRWLGRDPLGGLFGSTLYQYVHNNPLRKTDPLGLSPDPPLLMDGPYRTPYVPGNPFGLRPAPHEPSLSLFPWEQLPEDLPERIGELLELCKNTVVITVNSLECGESVGQNQEACQEVVKSIGELLSGAQLPPGF